MYYLRHFFCFTSLACTFSLFAQNDAYDLSQYKARYERRPGMELNFNSSFAGSYQWTFRLQASAQLNHIVNGRHYVEVWGRPRNDFRFTPTINFSTNYLFF